MTASETHCTGAGCPMCARCAPQPPELCCEGAPPWCRIFGGGGMRGETREEMDARMARWANPPRCKDVPR
jgi:hypothetical protein